MNPPTSTTRLIGTPRRAKALYLAAGLVVVAWLGGAVPWWLGITALCFFGTVRNAEREVRRYDAWWAEWQAMGGVPVASTRKPSGYKRAMVAVLALVMIPMLIAAYGTQEALRTELIVEMAGLAVYTLWKFAVWCRRLLSWIFADRRRAGENRTSATTDVVEWVLPPARSSPSRADAVRHLPEYCAKLMSSR